VRTFVSVPTYREAENIEELLRRKTSIVIAHRLSTARMADLIVVMEAGTIAEQGSHDQLVARGGLYARLWQRHSASQVETDALLSEAE